MTIPDQNDLISDLRRPAPMIQPRESTLAIVSMITGILGWTFLPVVGSLAAVITGHLAKKEIREGNGLLSGSGMATAGLILGYIQLVFVFLAIVAIILVIMLSPKISGVFNNLY